MFCEYFFTLKRGGFEAESIFCVYVTRLLWQLWSDFDKYFLLEREYPSSLKLKENTLPVREAN